MYIAAYSAGGLYCIVLDGSATDLGCDISRLYQSKIRSSPIVR